MTRLEVDIRHRFESGFELEARFDSDAAITALFGASGAGKSSVLMAIAGLLRPAAGRIVWSGRVLYDAAVGRHLAPERRRIGMVFQDQRLFPHLTAAENLRYAERRRPPAGRRIDRDRVVATLDLGALLERRPPTLSGGERQRLALARALMAGPELLLLDEPIAAVDEPRRNVIIEYVERLIGDWDIPMLYVSHHRAEVQRLADRVVVMDAGRVVESGAAEEVLGRLAGAGIGGELINLVRVEDPRRLDDGAVSVAVAGTGGAVRLRLPQGPSPSDRGADRPRASVEDDAVGAAGPDRPGPSVAETAWVQFSPSDVMLARGVVSGLSARNRLPATVRELARRRGRVFVALTVGDQSLWAEVTEQAAAELELAPGAEVTCLLKTAALELV